jgi:hypothetical protein
MRTPYLQHLSPFPIHIEENSLVGGLYIRYNPDDHYMVVSFKYEKKDHTPAPLIVYVEVAGKQYRHVLFICDHYNNLVKTTMFKPEYSVWDGIRLCSIWPIVSRDEKKKNCDF